MGIYLSQRTRSNIKRNFEIMINCVTIDANFFKLTGGPEALGTAQGMGLEKNRGQQEPIKLEVLKRFWPTEINPSFSARVSQAFLVKAFQ